MSNNNHNPFKPVRDNEIFKYIFINREKRISLTNTKVGGDLEITGSLTIPNIDNTIIGAITPSSATFTTTLTNNSTIVTSNITGNQTIGGNLLVSGETTLDGNLIINGSTTTVRSENQVISDTIIELGNNFTGTPLSTRDSGIVIERGASTNVFMGWDESEDKFVMGTTVGTGSSETIQISSVSTLVANLEGNITGNSESVTNGLYTTDVGTITNTNLGTDSVSNIKIVNSTISLSKLVDLNSSQIIVGNSSNRPTARTVSGDVTISNT